METAVARHTTHEIPPAEFRVLLALLDGTKHGHAIKLDIRERTGGRIDMGPGTLYGAIKRMLNADLIEESDNRPDPDMDDERRRYYRVTGHGARVLTAELARLEQLVRAAEAKKVASRLQPGWEGAP